MKKILILFLLIPSALWSQAIEQNQYFIPSYMAYQPTMKAFISSAHSFMGYKGSPKELAFAFHTPLTLNPQNKKLTTHFIGVNIASRLYSIYSHTITTAQYSYNLPINQYSLSMGMALGANIITQDYAALGSELHDPVLDYFLKQNRVKTSLAWQASVLFLAPYFTTGIYKDFAGNSYGLTFAVHTKYNNSKEKSYDYGETEKKIAFSANLTINALYHATPVAKEKYTFQAEGRIGIGVVSLGGGYCYPRDANASLGIEAKRFSFRYHYHFLQMQTSIPKHEISVSVKIFQKVEY